MLIAVRRWLLQLVDRFWALPAAMTAVGAIGAIVLVEFDRTARLPAWVLESAWIYNGGATGARTLLGAVASSTIGVAGTVFSITIAALSLAAGQMGPRLLRNFTHDRGNQFTLGVFLGTYSYALMVLRSVRTASEGEFVPHVSLSIGLLLAFGSVATLVYFVGHMAGRINVDTVIELVSDEVGAAIARLSLPAPQAVRPEIDWSAGTFATDPRRGYLQEIDHAGLASWAARHDVAIRLFVRPGDYVFPGTTVAIVVPARAAEDHEADDAIRRAISLGPERVSTQDLEYPIRQLVEVAVRALSPGINDPHTAISVLDRLGAALCGLVDRHLPSGVVESGGRVVLVGPSVQYGGLCDAMFHMVRQNAQTDTPVLLRLVEVLTAVADIERVPARLAELQRHADLVLGDAERNVTTPADLADVRERHARFVAIRAKGPRALLD